LVTILVILKTPNIFSSFVWVWNVVFNIKKKIYTGAAENSILRNIFAHSVESREHFGSNRLLGVPEGVKVKVSRNRPRWPKWFRVG
jgi:hypothetical protein